MPDRMPEKMYKVGCQLGEKERGCQLKCLVEGQPGTIPQ